VFDAASPIGFGGLHFIGNPIVALLLCRSSSRFWSLSRARHFTRAEIMKFLQTTCLAPTATILLVIGAGGGFQFGARGRAAWDGAHRRRGNRITRVTVCCLPWIVAALIRVRNRNRRPWR